MWPGSPTDGAATRRYRVEVPPPEPAPEPVLPDRSADDCDQGWGESGGDSGRPDDWYRQERPPHHGG